MAYTTINKSTDYFNTKLYTGNATNPTTISGVGFQPDWVWTKLRAGGTEGHRLCDAVRGATKDLLTNDTSAELTNTTGLKSFNSDGYVIGNSNGYNFNNGTFASWNWKANGAGSANTDGSINSTVSVNTTAGFSIVKFTGTGANATVGHGLGAVPKFIFGKNTNSGSSAWPVYSSVLGGTKYLNINTTSGEGTYSGYWNNTNPTSSVISIGSHGDVNGSGNSMIYYCFAEKTGYSKFGSYSGNNNADGTFIYTGFAPAFVMVKRYGGGTQSWGIVDNKRSNYNLISAMLNPNSSGTEGGNNGMDLLSNGFKMRSSDGNSNGYSDGYIYMALGQSLVGTNNIPATAR